jgi:hypothetical protein
VVRFVLALLALGGCDDQIGVCAQPMMHDGNAPNIRMLQYSPNAGFVGDDNMFNGSVLYSDSDKDVSQGVVEVIDPAGMLLFRSDPAPVMGVTGITGTANFMFSLDKTDATQTGIYHFCIWVVDLARHESNHVGGDIRMATHSPYDNMTNP